VAVRRIEDAESDSSGRAESAVQTISRAADLLRALASAPAEGGMLSDLARRCDLGKATTHRLLTALIDVGFAFQEPATRRYRLSAGLAVLGHAAHQQDMAATAQLFVRRIAEATEDTAYASVREGAAAVCVAREIGAFPIRTLSLEVGHRRPLGVGSGSLALLAFLPDDEIEQILKRNEAWLGGYKAFDAAALRRFVAETRRNGYAFINGLLVPGMNAIGVPVLDAAKRPVAALSLAAIADRVKGARIRELVGVLQREAASLAAVLGSAPAATRPRAGKPA